MQCTSAQKAHTLCTQGLAAFRRQAAGRSDYCGSSSNI